MENKKRNLPRHVDGRIMVGFFPIKNFIFFIIFALPTIIFVLLTFSPVSLFLGSIFLGILTLIFGEISYRQTGLEVLIETFNSLIEGDVIYERSCLDVPIYKRFIKNKKIQEIKRKKSN